jgi:4-hydroxybutyrate dehydrogenase
MNPNISEFAFPTRVVFGAGAIGRLGSEMARFGIRRPLLVTDRGIVESGLVETVRASIDHSPLVLFDSVNPNPTEQNVLAGIERYRSEGCNGIIAVGGGSPLDAAKAIRLGVTHPLPLELYDDQLNGGERIGSNLPPMIAVPTTSGTGSEVGRSAVIYLKSTDRKTVIFSPHLIPSSAIDDPQLTLKLPPPITAGTGFDALTHNVEAYLAKGYHPLCDAIALYGTRLAAVNLPLAVRDGGNLTARTNMMMASLMGAVAFQKGLGATHSLAHPLSSMGGLHHGTTNGILLPHVLEFNRPLCEDRLQDLAVAMGVNVVGKAETEAATAAIEHIQRLLKDVDIPDRLSSLGIERQMIPAMAKKAMEDACHHLNPRPCTEQDMATLYEKAL